jgi:hypothetical protein
MDESQESCMSFLAGIMVCAGLLWSTHYYQDLAVPENRYGVDPHRLFEFFNRTNIHNGDNYVKIHELNAYLNAMVHAKGYDVSLRDYHQLWNTPLTLECIKERYNLTSWELYTRNEVHYVVALDAISKLCSAEIAFGMDLFFRIDTNLIHFLNDLDRQQQELLLIKNDAIRAYMMRMIEHVQHLLHMRFQCYHDTLYVERHVSEAEVFHAGYSVIEGYVFTSNAFKFNRPSYYSLNDAQYVVQAIESVLGGIAHSPENKTMHSVLATHHMMHMPGFIILFHDWLHNANLSHLEYDVFDGL